MWKWWLFNILFFVILTWFFIHISERNAIKGNIQRHFSFKEKEYFVIDPILLKIIYIEEDAVLYKDCHGKHWRII